MLCLRISTGKEYDHRFRLMIETYIPVYKIEIWVIRLTVRLKMQQGQVETIGNRGFESPLRIKVVGSKQPAHVVSLGWERTRMLME